MRRFRFRPGGAAALAVSAAVLLGLRASPAQAPDSPDARRARLLKLIIESGASGYDEQARLVRDAGGRPTVAEGSLEYAAALLAAGELPERAAAVVDAVLSAQNLTPKSPRYGAFPWRPGEEIADDLAAAYVAPWLAYLHRHCRDRLPAEIAERLDAAVAPAAGAVSRLKAAPAETTACLVKIAGELSLAAELPGRAGGARAAADFAGWMRYAEKSGLADVSAPGSCALDLAALQWIRLAAPDDATKAGAAAALEYLYRNLALRFQPRSGMVAGAIPRYWPGDAVGQGPARYVLYGAFGQPELSFAPPFAMALTPAGYAPNAETVETAARLDTPRVVRTRSVDRATTTYVHPLFSLGTMTGAVEAQTIPVLFTYPSQTAPSAYCLARPTSAWVAAVQQDAKALVSFDFDEIGQTPARAQAQVDFYLGARTALRRALINETAYFDAAPGAASAAYPAAIDQGSTIITEREGVYTAITIALAGPAVAGPRDALGKPGVLEWVAGAPGTDELVLHAYARREATPQPARNNYRLVLALEMAGADAYPTVEQFTQAVLASRVKKSLTTKRVKVGEKGVNPHAPPGFMRPVERGNWIYESLVTQDLQFVSGSDTLVLTEDLEKRAILAQTINGAPVVWDFLYRSPSLNQLPGDPLSSVLRPPPPPPPAPAPSAAK